MTPIDIGSIATVVIPYLVKGANAFATKAGDKLAEKIVDLYKTVENKFREDPHAEETLILAKEKPESKEYQKKLEGVLIKKMEEDSDFAEKVLELVKKAQEESCTVFDQRSQNVDIQTDINKAYGPVYSGKFNRPINNSEAKEKHEEL